MVKVNGYWSGLVLGFRVRSRVEQWSRWRHPMTCRWRGLGLTWTCLHGCWREVMTSSDNVRWHQQQISARGRRVLSPPAHEGDARNPRGVWGRMWGRMRPGILGSVDWWMRRPSGWRMYQEDDLEVRNLRRHVGDFSETIVVRGKASGDRISGLWSREVVEHVCGFGFVRQSLNLCKSNKLSHSLLGLRIWTHQWAMAAARCCGV